MSDFYNSSAQFGYVHAKVPCPAPTLSLESWSGGTAVIGLSGGAKNCGVSIFIGQASGEEDFSNPVESIPYGTTSVTITGLNPSATYFFVAKGLGCVGQGWGCASNEVQTTVLQVATPTFSPVAGIYPETEIVTIACSTAGASIYYTVDGSTPTPSSHPYTGGISVSENTTIKAIATKAGYLNSNVGSASYTIVQGQLSGLSWMFPCFPAGGVPGQYCQCSNTPDFTISNSTTLDGAPSTSYSVTIRIRGVFETKAYTGGTTDGEFWQTGGSPDATVQNWYQLTISDPAQTYYINAGWAGAPVHNNTVYVVDYEKTLTIASGAVVTLAANTGTDQYEAENVGNDSYPAGLSVTDNDPSHPIVVTQPYNGQFAQIDAITVVPL